MRSALLVVLGFGVAVALAACGGSHRAKNSCSRDQECGDGRACVGGYCVDAPRTCTSIDPCPSGYNCCGGTCTASQCCVADFDCASGYCETGVCKSGARPQCNATTPCANGRCLSTIGQCVECLYTDDCDIGLVCSAQHTCVQAGGCTAQACAATGLICAPEEGGCRPCLTTAECGNLVCAQNGVCSSCTSAAQCGANRDCEDGVCVAAPGTPCATTTDCADGLVCKQVGIAKQCEPCINTTECGSSKTCQLPQGRCVPNGGTTCQADTQCNPPTTVCSAGTCGAGCTTGSCRDTEICNPTTGRCVPFSDGDLVLGQACDAHSDCLTNICWPIATDAGVEKLCSQTCNTHADCPQDYVCGELGDGNLCVHKSHPALPTGNYNVAPGGACSGGFESTTCVSAYCNTVRGQCMEMCGRDADCKTVDASFACIMRWPVGDDFNQNGTYELEELAGFTELCHPPLFQGLPNGSICSTGNHDVCASGMCAQTPNLFVQASCANPCCTPADCTTSGSICKPLDTFDGIRADEDIGVIPYSFQKVCLWKEFSGTKELGDTCASNADCKSEICVAGPSGVKRCTQTCCRNADCLGFSWAQACRPPFANSSSVVDDSVADANFIDVATALGRESAGLAGFGTVGAVTTLCMPK